MVLPYVITADAMLAAGSDAGHAETGRSSRSQAADVTAAVPVPAEGALFPSPLLQADMAEVVATFETNVFGALRVARSFAPALSANGGGALVDMHSVFSWGAGAGAYGASKAALWSITNSLRVELSR